MSQPIVADLLGRPMFSGFSQTERFAGGGDDGDLERVLNSLHSGAMAALAVASSDHADAMMLRAIAALVQRDEAGLDATLVAAVACLRTLPEHPGQRAALPLTRALDVIAHAMVGRPVRVFEETAKGLPGAELSQVLLAISAASVGESERAVSVEKAVREAGFGGAELSLLSSAVVDLCYARPGRTAHLTPILVACLAVARVATRTMAVDLLARMARTLIVRSLPGNLTQQGLIAPMIGAAAQLHAAQDEGKAAAFQEARFRPHLLGAKPETLVRAVAKALAFGIPRNQVAISLTLAAAERLTRFDPAIAASVRRPETWLDLGWLLQITEAIRALGTLHERPAWIGLLLHGALWLRQAASLDASPLPALPEPTSLARTWDHGPEIARVTGAMLRGDGATAMAVVRGYLLMVLPEQPLSAAIAAAALEDRAASAAEQGVLLATVVAALSGFGAAATLAHRDLLPCAALHLWTAPQPVRPVYALAHAAVDRAEGAGAGAKVESALPWLVQIS